MEINKRLNTLYIHLPQHRYPIYIGQSILQNVSLWGKHIQSKRITIITDKNIASLYLKTLLSALHDFTCDTIVLPEGESYKTLVNVEFIWKTLIEKKHDRQTTLLALGGGVIGDMSGFAAACYQRGVAFIQIPSSLLAQVDSAIGGKTAINYAGGKNMIGAFHHPQCVVVDIDLLNSLPKRYFISGLAEVVKYALLSEDNFLTDLENHVEQILSRDKTILTQMIYRSCLTKIKFIEKDEKDKHQYRALLNLGHTFAHAIETASDYRYLHGEAVAMGLILALDLSQRLNLIAPQDKQRVALLLNRLHLPTRLPTELDCQFIYQCMAMDKKAYQDKLRFILLNKLGCAIMMDNISAQDILLSLHSCQKNNLSSV